MSVYKYISSQNLAQFREKGTVRIGNMKLYRDIVHAPVCDPDEGRMFYRIETGDSSVTLTPQEANALTNEFLVRCNIKIAPNSFLESELSVPNAFVFSTSRILDEKLMEKWEYDAYYEIIDPLQFGKFIYDELGKKVPLLGYHFMNVIYVKTKTIKITNENKLDVIRIDSNEQSNPKATKVIYVEDYFTKIDEFKDEKEFRLVFIPAVPISKIPFYLNCPKLLSCCKF